MNIQWYPMSMDSNQFHLMRSGSTLHFVDSSVWLVDILINGYVTCMLMKFNGHMYYDIN